MYLFNPNESGSLKYVHPVKKEKLRRLLSSDIPEHVEKIYLFGSCLDLTCKTESDIDLYFITDEQFDVVIDELHDLCRITANNFDLIVKSNDDFVYETRWINSIESRIKREGLLIYEKEKIQLT